MAGRGQAAQSQKVSVLQQPGQGERIWPQDHFGLVDKLLQKKTETSLPQHSSLDDLVEDFSSFFVNKIQGLRQQLSSYPLDSTVAVPDLVSRQTTATPPLSCFRHVDDSEVLRVVSASSPKSCSLDLLPTTILKANIDVLLLALTRIINHSIMAACFPSAFKGAHVMPLLKKSSLDQDTMKNYRLASPMWRLCWRWWRESWPPSLMHHAGTLPAGACTVGLQEESQHGVCPPEGAQWCLAGNWWEEVCDAGATWPLCCLWHHQPRDSFAAPWDWHWCLRFCSSLVQILP